jgi:hypothetical protein
MQHLVLFLTQGEGGAPGYLSRLGEDGAISLAETLEQFLKGLGFNFEDGAAQRSAGLYAIGPAEKVSFEVSLAAALGIYGEVLVCSGASTRSRKTLEPLVEHLVLPVVVVDGLDVSATQAQELRKDVDLAASLPRIFDQNESTGKSGIGPPLPRLVLIQTSLAALGEWLVGASEPSVAGALVDSLREASEGDRVPVLAALGYEGPWPGRWIIDSGDGSNS